MQGIPGTPGIPGMVGMRRVGTGDLALHSLSDEGRNVPTPPVFSPPVSCT